MTGPDEIRERLEEWRAAGSERTVSPAPIAKVVGRVLDDLEQQQVAQRWRLYGSERGALANLARTLGEPEREVKLYLAHVGLVLARAEESDHQPGPSGADGSIPYAGPEPHGTLCRSVQGEDAARWATLVRRAIHHARRALADSGPMPGRFVELTQELVEEDAIADISLAELAEHPHAPGFAVADLVSDLQAAATAPQERELIDAFLNEGCSTLEEVRRFMGWSKGHAATIARRLRAKARRGRAA